MSPREWAHSVPSVVNIPLPMEKALQLVIYLIWRSEHGSQSLVMETNHPFLKEGRLRELENDTSSEMDSIDAPAVERISCWRQESLRRRL